MRLLLTVLLFSSFLASKSQNLEANIPSGASMVITLNAPVISNALPYSELEKSTMISKVISDFAREMDISINSYEDIGINSKASSYFFSQKINDQVNLVMLIPISDRKFAESFIEKQGGKISTEGNLSVVHEKGSWTFVNDNSLAIVQVMNTPEDSSESPPNYLSVANQSIQSVKEYKKQKDDNAAISFWVNDFSSLAEQFSGLLGTMQGMMEQNSMASMYNGYESMNAKLFVDSEETRLTVQVSLSKENAANYKKITNQKFNEAFFSYVDLNKSLGYLSTNINVENLLIEYPTMLNAQISSIPEASQYQAEIDLGISLFSTMLDEEAIGEVIKGDILISLSGISNKEVEYITYEYDSNFQSIPITNTRMEKVPDFIALASTTEGDLTRSTIKYLIKSEIIHDVGGFYKVNAGKSVPVDIYFLIKNNIVFIGSNKEQFQSIASNRLVTTNSTEFQNHIRNSQMAFYAGVKRASSSLEPGDFPDEKTYTQIVDLLDQSPDIYMTVDKFRGNVSRSSLSVTTPAGHKNAATYLIGVLENLNK